MVASNPRRPARHGWPWTWAAGRDTRPDCSRRRRGAAGTVGLDRSSAFLCLARAESMENITFVEHDVGTVPFPVGQADVIFASCLLSHFLPDPEAVVARWLTQLAPGGVLLLEENETITTAEPAFRDYLARAVTLIRERGGELEVGARLARLASGGACPWPPDRHECGRLVLPDQR
ncbi:MAG: class I SAM-dependent methyltransferase [Pseudonocardiaceae bacterium]